MSVQLWQQFLFAKFYLLYTDACKVKCDIVFTVGCLLASYHLFICVIVKKCTDWGNSSLPKKVLEEDKSRAKMV